MGWGAGHCRDIDRRGMGWPCLEGERKRKRKEKKMVPGGRSRMTDGSTGCIGGIAGIDGP